MFDTAVTHAKERLYSEARSLRNDIFTGAQAIKQIEKRLRKFGLSQRFSKPEMRSKELMVKLNENLAWQKEIT